MDPIAQAKHAAAKIETAREAMAEARQERRAAVLAARETMGAADVAEQLGISKARVYKIANGGE